VTAVLPQSEGDLKIETRAGVDHLGEIRCNQKVKVALRNLGRQVVEVAVDRGIESILAPRYPDTLDYGRDNRSVTDPQWVEKGLERYGCPIHSNPGVLRSGGNASFRTRIELCSCKGGASRPVYVSTWRARRNHELRSADSATRRVGSRNWRAANGDGCAGDNPASRTPVWQSVHYRRAVSAALSVAGDQTGARRPYSVVEVVENHIHNSHYAGYPYFCRNKDAMDSALRDVEAITAGKRSFHPYLAGRRVQSGNAGPKTRLVWMASLSTTIVGTRFSKRVSEAMAKRRPFVWGLRDMDKGALVSELESRFRYIYCFDFSGFDSSISSEMIDDAFGIAKTHLDLSVEDEDLWKRYVSDFIHSRLLSHTGEVYRVHRGVPSGSAFTSIIDSIVNLIAINYAWSKVTGHAPNQDRMLILGDDAVIASDVRIDVGELASAFSDLGLTLGVGAGKTSVVDTHNSREGYANLVHFLGRYWRCGEPVRPEFELLQRMILPERHKARTREESILRFYSYLSDCKEAFYVFRQVYSEPDPVQAFLHALRDAGEHEIPLDDLPGALRFKVAVEGDDETTDMVRRHGLSIGMTSRLTA